MKTNQFMGTIEEHIKNGTLKDWAGEFQEIVTPEKLNKFRAENKLGVHIVKHLQDGDFKEWIGKFQEITTPKKLENLVQSISALLVKETGLSR